jgi:hypothetical protein
MPPEELKPAPVTDIHGARVLGQAGRLGHHRPHPADRGDQDRLACRTGISAMNSGDVPSVR